MHPPAAKLHSAGPGAGRDGRLETAAKPAVRPCEAGTGADGVVFTAGRVGAERGGYVVRGSREVSPAMWAGLSPRDKNRATAGVQQNPVETAGRNANRNYLMLLTFVMLRL